MNYSQAQIANLALGRIGARGSIVSLTENSPNAVKVNMVWDAIFQEVLSERDWKFAKTRTQLALSPIPPLYAYTFAWALPSDFLRFVRPHKRPHDRHDWYWGWGFEGTGWYNRHDPPLWPTGTVYVVETLPSYCNFVGSITGNVLTVSQITAGQLSLNQPVFGRGVSQPTYISAFSTGTGYTGTYTLSNGNNTTPNQAMYSPNPLAGRSKYALMDYCGDYGPVKINYIQLITDYTQLMPGFVNSLANRLAAELSIAITEDKQKWQGMMEMYRDSLNSAEAQNETMDFQKDEAGSESWVRAGRNAGYGGGGWY